MRMISDTGFCRSVCVWPFAYFLIVTGLVCFCYASLGADDASHAVPEKTREVCSPVVENHYGCPPVGSKDQKAIRTYLRESVNRTAELDLRITKYFPAPKGTENPKKLPHIVISRRRLPGRQMMQRLTCYNKDGVSLTSLTMQPDTLFYLFGGSAYKESGLITRLPRNLLS